VCPGAYFGKKGHFLAGKKILEARLRRIFSGVERE
jgi:hypothetical protein